MDELQLGLRALAETAFPKTCNTCGRAYASLDNFLAETEGLRDTSGLRQAPGEKADTVVGLFRHCSCGSTLPEFCADRRGNDDDSLQRRERFGKLLALLEREGLDVRVARRELMKLVHGERSEILEAYRRRQESTRRPGA